MVSRILRLYTFFFKILILFCLLAISQTKLLIASELINHGNFQIKLYKKNDRYAMSLIKDLDKISKEIQDIYNLPWLNKIPIIIELVDVENEDFVIHKEFADLPSWVAGYALPDNNRIVIRYRNIGAYPYLNLKAVLKHELSHIFLSKICKVNNISVPKWFDEGLAMYVEKKWDIQDYYQASINSLIYKPIPLKNLQYSFPYNEMEAKIAYVESFSFINYLVRKNRNNFIKDVINRLLKGEEFEKIILVLTKRTIEENEKNWRKEVFTYYKWIPLVASTGFLWIIITLFALFFYWRKRKKDEQILKKWELEENGA